VAFASIRFNRPSREGTKIHLQTLLIAKIKDFAATSRVDLLFDDFRCDESLEQRARKGRATQLGFRFDPKQVAGQTGIQPIELRGFDQTFAEIREIRRNHDD